MGNVDFECILLETVFLFQTDIVVYYKKNKQKNTTRLQKSFKNMFSVYMNKSSFRLSLYCNKDKPITNLKQIYK